MNRVLLVLVPSWVVFLASLGTRADSIPGHGNVTRDVDCAACHTAEGWSLSKTAGGGGFDHARTGFPLIGRHRGAPCLGCHAPGKRTRSACGTCHSDAHQGRLGSSCENCHGSTDWRSTRARERHQSTRLPLDGAHAWIDCAACHRRSALGSWSGLSPACYSCHEDDFRRETVHPRHIGEAGMGAFDRNCSNCHETLAWSPAYFPAHGISASALERAPENHDAFFPIRFGKHRGLACGSCHGSREARGAVTCTGCHVHRPARLAATHSQGFHPSGRACLACHPGGMSP